MGGSNVKPMHNKPSNVSLLVLLGSFKKHSNATIFVGLHLIGGYQRIPISIFYFSYRSSQASNFSVREITCYINHKKGYIRYPIMVLQELHHMFLISRFIANSRILTSPKTLCYVMYSMHQIF